MNDWLYRTGLYKVEATCTKNSDLEYGMCEIADAATKRFLRSKALIAVTKAMMNQIFIGMTRLVFYEE